MSQTSERKEAEEIPSKTILIIEDYEGGIANTLRTILEDDGYRVKVWISAKDAYPFQKPFPDLIFLDLHPLTMNGKKICQELKKQPDTRSLPIILMSVNKNLPQIASEIGADDWLFKPFNLETIFALLNKYIRTAASEPPD